MKTYVVFSSREPVLIVTRQAISSKAILNQLGRVGIHKFIAREISIDFVRHQYGRQFEIIEKSLRKRGDFRVLDYSGRRIFRNLPFSELGPAYRRESHPVIADSNRESPRPAFRPNPDPASQSWL